MEEVQVASFSSRGPGGGKITVYGIMVAFWTSSITFYFFRRTTVGTLTVENNRYNVCVWFPGMSQI